MSDCAYPWCQNPDHDAEPTFHDGVLTVARADSNAIPISIYMDTREDDPTLLFNLQFDYWTIQHDNVRAEFAAIRSIIDQYEAAVTKAVATHAGDLRQTRLQRKYTAHRGSAAHALRRRNHVDNELRELSD